MFDDGAGDSHSRGKALEIEDVIVGVESYTARLCADALLLPEVELVHGFLREAAR